MAETYCGKSCADCEQKEQLNCPGCKTGPGRQFGGDCELAKCVRSKGHETCQTCGFKGNCGTLRSCDHMPNYRCRKMQAEEMRKAAIAKRASILGKWLWIFFWLFIPGNVAGLMTNESIVEVIPVLSIPGHIISVAVTLAYGLILVKLASIEDRYRTAGICYLVANGVNVLLPLLSEVGGSSTWTLLITLPAAVVALVSTYNEYMAHSAVLTGVDNDLSEKWCKLWKWEIGLMGTMVGSLLVAFIIPLLGALAVLACAIGTIVVGILKLVYLYRTAKIFREYPVGV